jgi:hypothetical protein
VLFGHASRSKRLDGLLLAFATADVLIAAGVMLAAHLAWLAAVVGLVAVAALVLHQRDRREAWLWVLLLAAVVLPVTVLVALRPPDSPVQDGLLLTDAAAGRLLAGADPYGHDYIDDAALRAFWLPEIPVNPLLAHFPYPPGVILLAVPLRAVGLSAAWLWPPGLLALGAAARAAAGRAGLVAASLSPLLLLDGLALFNDLFFLAAALAAWALLGRRHAAAAGVAAAVALALKQPALVFAPALLWLAWSQGKPAVLRFVLSGAGALAVIVGPFLAWNATGFAADTLTYFYGAGVDSFPIRGPGLAGILLGAGALPSRWAPFPAALIQVPALALVVVAGWRWLGGRPWLWAALVGAVLFGLGRTLAPNYVTVIGVLLSLEVGLALDRPEAPAEIAPVKAAAGPAGVEGTA